MSKIKDSKKRFNSFNKELYKQLYFNYENGGYVVAHKKHGHLELEQNVIIAKTLADLGDEVELIEDLPNTKSPDAIRNNDYWEFKTISRAKNISRAIETAIRSGRKQANNIVLFINQNQRIADVRYGIFISKKNGKLGNLQQIDILFPNGNIIKLKRSDIENGKLAQKFKGS